MLSKDMLSQLSELKQTIRSSTDYMTGTVRATSGRYGFVNLEDGREAFLNPEQMGRVFHGDQVEIIVTQNAKEQNEATLHKLLSSSVKKITGRYHVRGKGHFVVCNNEGTELWLFVPPKVRKNAKEGDYVVAIVTQHPYKTGKSQAKVIAVLGDDNTPFITRQYTLAKYDLEDKWPQEALTQATNLAKAPYASSAHDDSHRPFITIDSASTRDMDDALTIEPSDNGWRLLVAIAYPGSDIALDSPLARAISERAHTVYFLGKSLSMMPDGFATERYSLIPRENRPALVCEMSIDTSGEIVDCQFRESTIRSQAKLSYQQVGALLSNSGESHPEHLDDAAPFDDMLRQLKQCADALSAYRQKHYLVTPHREDTHYNLNHQGKIDGIERIEKTQAHTIVEESMLALNRQAGAYLATHDSGIHSRHLGFKDERRQDIEQLLSEKLDITIGDTSQLVEYQKIIHHLLETQNHPLFSICQRFLRPGELSTTPEAHFGLGFDHYTMVSSPIRRYQDFVNQHMIVSLLNHQPIPKFTSDQLSLLKDRIRINREASRFLENRLVCEFMNQHTGKEFAAQVTLLTNQGIGVRLNDYGIEGFITSKKANRKKSAIANDKLSFNNQRMELKWNDHPVLLDQLITVTLVDIDLQAGKLLLEWADAPEPNATSSASNVAPSTVAPSTKE